jgi:AcrR family transcriptional regulator
VAAASELLAAHGESALTVRAVSQAAGANVAAVKYHFGSRDGLIAEVDAQETRPVAEAQRAALEALGPGSPAGAWVRAWAAPLIEVAVSGTPDARRLGRLIGQGHSLPLGELDTSVRDAVAEATRLLLDGLEAALPGVPRAELVLRLALAASALAGLAGGAYEPFLTQAEPGRELEQRILQRLVAVFTV